MSITKQLPAGWASGLLGDLLPIRYGKALRSDARAESGKFSVFGSNGVVGQHDVALTSGPSIIVGRKGGAGLVHFSSDPCWVIDTAYYTEANTVFDLKLGAYWLRALQLEALDRSTAIPSLSRDDYSVIAVSFPPKSEQKRIIGKIEELLSDLDAGVAALERARANLKRYRAAVLKAAVEGRLTAEWRKANPAAEPADKLLERILAERRRTWEETQLAKFAAQGKQPLKGWKDKYSEPAKPDTVNLPELPEGWCWVTMDELVVSGPQNGLYMHQSAYGSGVPILRIDDFQNDWSRGSNELRLVEISKEDFTRYELVVGDILINRVNSLTHLGKCLTIEARHVPAVFESNMMRMRCSEFCHPDYPVAYLRSVSGIERLVANAKWAVNQASINQTDVARTPVPLPPLDEQRQIISLVDERLSIIKTATLETQQQLGRTHRLRQAILKRAFEGKLVPQDPSDEPASVLLERIRNARAAEGTQRAHKRRKSPA